MFLNDLFLENDDDMFAPSKAQQVYQALRNAAQYQLTEYMEMLHAGGDFDKDFAANRIREVPTIVGLANKFKSRGLESGLIEWRELQSQDEDPHFSVTDYMSDAVGEAIGVTLYKLYNQVCLRKGINEQDDEMFADTSKPGRYWSNPPEYYSKLWNELVPDSGAAQTLEGELLRAASRLYYDYYNNGMGNNTSGAENFLRNFGDGSMRMQKALAAVHPFTRGITPDRSEEPAVAAALEVIVDSTVKQILAAGGNYHPNPGNLFDYSERDDPYPEEDDDYYDDEDEYDDEDPDTVYEASFQFDLDDEPEPPKKTQTKDKPKFSHDPFQQQAAQPLANRPEEPRGAEQPAAPRMRQATAAATRRAAGNIAPTDQMRDMLSRMRDIEIDPDLADYPEDEPTFDVDVNVNTENLPAVAGQAIAAAGETSPEFHQVARLPGNMSRMIRQLGKALFGSMTNTPTEDIYMIGNLGGQGPNTRMEVNAVANFVRENGQDLGPGDIDFDAVMPGYSAQTHQYEAAGIRWLLVKDFAGEYIYAWPEADSKTSSNRAQLGNAPKRIRWEPQTL